jgi:hypothetical protein
MARLVACYAAHEADCPGGKLGECPCTTGFGFTVDVEFDVPDGASMREAIAAARWAGGLAAVCALEGA